MKIRIGIILLLVNLLDVLLIASIVYSLEIPRIILGLNLVLFFPGLTLMAALFPGRNQLGGVERTAFSFGLSIAIVPLTGLALNYTPWGITLNSMLASLASFIFIMSAIGWIRTVKLPEDSRLRLEFRRLQLAAGTTILDKTLTGILILAVLGAFGTTGYLIQKPRIDENFTEFYMLGREGKLADYPRQVNAGQAGEVTLGISNREHRTVSYGVTILIDGREIARMGPIVLEESENWEGEAAFIPGPAGVNQKVEFLLFKGDEREPSMSPLHLWIDVAGQVK